MLANIKFTVLIIESEYGWGQSVDEVKEFDTEKERDDFIVKFNSANTKESVPNWYMYAIKGENKVVLIAERCKANSSFKYTRP